MKKILCILIFILIIFTPIFKTYAFDFKENSPKDIDEHWAENSILLLKNMGVMNGFIGYINPDSIVTRGEFTALVTRAFSLKSGQSSKAFNDIAPSHIFYDAIMAASNAGIIDGFNDNTFRPDNMITREEIMLIMSRINPGYASKLASFTDINRDYIYISQLSKIVEDGIISGYPDGGFKPYNKTTRAEAAQIIVRALKKYLPAADINSVYQFAYDYTTQHFSNIDKAFANASGSALGDLEYVKNTYDTALGYGYQVTNAPANIVISNYNQTGPFTEFLIDYNVTTTVNGTPKTYKGQSKLYTVTKNGTHSVYKHETRIIEPGFINLAWEVFSAPPSYAPKGVNVVSPTCFRIEQESGDKSQVINFDGSTLYFNSDLTDEYLNYARRNGYKVWAMYKTDFKVDTASLFLNNNNARKQASRLLTREILKNNLDGINFDFENMYKKDKGAYTNHVREISLMAHTLGAAVSVDITKYEATSSNWSMCYNRDSLAKYADYIMLMAYDQYYGGGKTAGPVAGFAWTENCINLTLKEVPGDKLVLGMPYYIRVWDIKNGRATGSKAISMKEALRLIEENSALPQYDSKFGLNKYSWEENGKTRVFWHENAETIRQRVAMAKRYNLAGVASWRRGFETLDVWDAIYNEIQN